MARKQGRAPQKSKRQALSHRFKPFNLFHESHLPWISLVYPTPQGLACLIASVVLIVCSRLLADRALMAVGLALAGLLVFGLLLALLGFLVPLGADGLPKAQGWQHLVCPRATRAVPRWQRLDQDDRVVDDFQTGIPVGRGVWRRVGWRLWWTSPFGMWRAGRIVRHTAEKIILPTPVDLDRTPVPAASSGALPEDLQSSTIRDYVNGDSLHLVSWKQSARHDSLMVQPENHFSRPRLLVVFDASPASAEEYDQAAALLFTVCHVARAQGWQATLTDGKHTFTRSREQDRYCAAILPPHTAPSKKGSSQAAAITSQGIRGGDSAQQTQSQKDESRLAAIASTCLRFEKEGQPVHLVPAQPGSAFEEEVVRTIRATGRKVVVNEPPRAPHLHKSCQSGPEKPENIHSLFHNTPQKVGTKTVVSPKSRHVAARVVQTTILPLLCLAILLTLAVLCASRLFGTSLWTLALTVLMGLAILLAWLPRARSGRARVLICGGEVILLIALTLAFIFITADIQYGRTWVPFTAQPVSGRVRPQAGALSPQGGNIFVGPPGSPSIGGLFATGFADFSASVLPLQASAGEQAILIAATGLLAILFRLILLCRRAAPLFAILPLGFLTMEWQFSGTPENLLTLFLTVGAIVLLFWAPDAHRLALLLPALTAIAVTIASVFAGTPLSQGSPDQLSITGNGGSLFSSSAINPLVDLKRGLTRNSTAIAFTYTSRRPVRFRLATLDNLSGSVWSFDQALGQQANLFSPTQNRSGQPRSRQQVSMFDDYPTSARTPFPRLSPFERTLSGLELLDESDMQEEESNAQNTTRSAVRQRVWRVTATEQQRSREQALRRSVSSQLPFHTSIHIADLSTRFLPLAGLPQTVGKIGGSWNWNRDRTVFNVRQATTSRLSYTAQSLYLPAISSLSQISGDDPLSILISLRQTYQQRCHRVLQTGTRSANRLQRDWRNWYRDADSLSRQQLQAWNSCYVDFSLAGGDHSASYEEGYNYSDPFTYWTNTSTNNALYGIDDDPDSSYLTTRDLFQGSPYEQEVDPYFWKRMVGREYRALPTHLPPAITNVVKSAKRQGIPVDGRGANHQLQAMTWLVRFFSNKSFHYSLNAPDGGGTNNLEVVARFLRERRGYCVHYASALAVLGRAMKVPTRIVLGYSPDSSVVSDVQGRNPTYATSQNQLHSWVEAFIDGVGWVPFDVTPGFSDAQARRTTVTSNDVTRDARRNTTSTTTSTAGGTGTNTTRQQGTENAQWSRQRTGTRRTNRREGASPRQHSQQARHQGRTGLIVALSVCAALLFGLICAGPFLARRLRRAIVFARIRQAGQSGSPPDAERAWRSAWKETLHAARRTGIKPTSTQSLDDIAQALRQKVPTRAPFITDLVGQIQTLAFARPGEHALPLSREKARRLEERLYALLDDLDQAGGKQAKKYVKKRVKK